MYRTLDKETRLIGVFVGMPIQWFRNKFFFINKNQFVMKAITMYFLISFLTVGYAIAQTTHYVNPDGVCDGNTPCYTTIQAAIDGAAAGDLIEVAAGVYTEALDVNKIDLTILGPNFGISGFSSTRGPEALIQGKFNRMRGQADGFILDGFRIETDGRAIYADNIAIIRNNVLVGSQPPSETFQSGIFSGTTRSLLVEQNYIEGFGWGLYLDGGPGSIASSFKENVITQVNTGIFASTGMGVSLGHEIIGNLFEANGTALYLPGRHIDSDVEGTFFLVEKNIIKNNDRGIRVGFPPNWTAAESIIIISENHFEENNEYALQNRVTGMVEATCNWWGTEVGNEIFDLLDGDGADDIIFWPWLIDGTDNEPGTPGFQPVPDACSGYFVFNQTKGLYYFSIQAAVDDADPGDTIIIKSGNYDESVTTVEAGGLTISPGSSPGCVGVLDLTYTDLDVVLVEIEGSVPCTGYDQINVTNTLTLGDSNLEIDLDYEPVTGTEYTIFTAGNIIGEFEQGIGPVTATFNSNTYYFHIQYHPDKVVLLTTGIYAVPVGKWALLLSLVLIAAFLLYRYRVLWT